MTDDRHLIDPDDNYPAAGPRQFEVRALEATRWRQPYVLTRTRDAIEVRFPDDQDDDGELVVLFTPEAIELRLYTIDWTGGSYGPAASSELWKRVSLRKHGDKPVGGLLDDLAAAHEARLETCIHCGESFIDARMAGDACQACAVRVEGVVF